MEERLQKVIAQAGVASRREAEKMILAGRVKVNGEICSVLGTKISEHDKVSVDDIPLGVKEEKTYLVLYKPAGYITSLKDPQGRKTVADLLKNVSARVYPVGRLDFLTEGLLLLTNDGELAKRMTHPSFEIPKTYRVTVKGVLSEEKKKMLTLGIPLEDGFTAPAVVDKVDIDQVKNITTFDLTIHEGRNRQVRRMCDFIGYPVLALTRVKECDITLTGMNKGEYRELTPAEVRHLKKAVGLHE